MKIALSACLLFCSARNRWWYVCVRFFCSCLLFFFLFSIAWCLLHCIFSFRLHFGRYKKCSYWFFWCLMLFVDCRSFRSSVRWSEEKKWENLFRATCSHFKKNGTEKCFNFDHFKAFIHTSRYKCGYCCYCNNNINTGGLCDSMPASHDFEVFAFLSVQLYFSFHQFFFRWLERKTTIIPFFPSWFMNFQCETNKTRWIRELIGCKQMIAHKK